MARILTVTNLYPPHHLGGYELSCRDVMARLVARGHTVTVLTSVERRPGVTAPDPDPAGGLEVRRVLPWWWEDHELLSPPVGQRVRQERRADAVVRDVLAEVDPDVVSVWNMGALSLGALDRIAARDDRTILSICDDWLDYGPRLDAFRRLFAGPPWRRAAGVVGRRVLGLPAPRHGPWPGAYLFVSDATKRAAERSTGWSFPRSAVVGSGIDHADFPVATGPVAERPWRGRLLFVGRVERRKGIEALLRSLPLLPGTTLDVVGPREPKYVPELDALVRDLGVGDRVTFDEVPRHELRARYAGSDAFVFPSEWEEPFGLVPIEAMACDTPVVASGTGGSAEFLRDGGNCLLAAPGDPAAIAAAVERLAGDPALRAALVRGGRDTARWASVDDLAAIAADWHEFAAAGFRGAAPGDRRPP